MMIENHDRLIDFETAAETTYYYFVATCIAGSFCYGKKKSVEVKAMRKMGNGVRKSLSPHSSHGFTTAHQFSPPQSSALLRGHLQ